MKAALQDRYAIEREVGSGGMATVYLAEDLKHHRKVAVKVLRPDIAATLGAERFLREIQVAAQLQHPHILPLHDSGEADGFLYYVMPYVEGHSLRDKLASVGELPIGDAVRILRDVVDALTEAHAMGVVHRDIKPENILLRGRHALVTDFGVAKAVSEATGRAKLTTAGVALGTPAYMAPEQAVADPNIDRRVDLYAVGAVAYELLTGRPPFTGSNAQAVLSAHVTEAAEPVTRHRETVPAALETVVMRCLEKKPADRWQSAEELLPALEALATPSGGITPTDTRPVSGVGRAGSPWVKAAVGATALAVVVVLAVALAGRGRGGPPIDPDLIAVFPFAVTGSEDVQYLGEGMVNLFESNLAAGEGLRAVAAQRSIAAWREAGGSEASAERSLEVGRSLGAGLALQGNLVASGDGLVVNATLTPTEAGEERRATASGPADSIAALVGRLTAELLVLQAGERADRAPALRDVPPEALRAYLEAQIAYREARWETALDEFGRALAIDSSFALAALGHAMARGWVLTARPSPGTRLAWTHRDKLPERDRILLEAMRPGYPDPVSFRERIAAAERAARMLPDRVEAWYYLGDRIFHYGYWLGMRPEEVRERTWAAFDRGLQVDPNFGPILTHKFDQAFMDGDFVAYRALADSYPDIAARNINAALGIAVRGRDSAAVERWFRIADTLSFDEVATASGLALFSGTMEVVSRASDLALGKATTAAERIGVLRARRAAYWTLGQPSAAAALTARIEREGGGDPLGDYRPIDAALFLDGDTVQADEAARAIEQALTAAGLEPGGAVPQGGVSPGQVFRLCYLGLWRAHTGTMAGARAIADQLRRIAARDEGSYGSLQGRVCSLELRGLLAEPAERRRIADELDSISASGPDIGAVGRNRMNLVLTQLFRSVNEPRRALGTAMRWDGFGDNAAALFREAGRQAAAVDDTALAVWYLDWYLRYRGDVEPHLRAADDQLRAELARLVGEGGTGR